MWYSFIPFYLFFTFALFQSGDQKNAFVDIRSVYHYSSDALSRLDAIEVCRKYSAWLVTFDHHHEFTDVSNFFRSIPLPLSGDGLRIQTSGVKNTTDAGDNHYYYDWYHLNTKAKNQFVHNWCTLFNGSFKYPVRLPHYKCLMIAMGSDQKWCYKNYDCNDHLPFICEKIASWPESAAADKSDTGTKDSKGDKKASDAKDSKGDKKASDGKNSKGDKKASDAKDKKDQSTTPGPVVGTGDDNVVSDGSS